MKKLLVIVAIALVGLVVVAGCSSGGGTTTTGLGGQEAGTTAPADTAPAATDSGKTEIKVGYSISLSGIYSAAAPSQKNPYQLWAEQVNAAGGIQVKDLNKSLPVKLIEYDDKSSSEDAVRIYNKLINDDKVDILLTPWGTTLTYALVPVVSAARMPFVGTTAAPTQDMRKDTGPYVFWTWPSPDITGVDAVDMLKSQQDQIKNVAVLYVNDRYPQSFGLTVVDQLKTAGFNVVLEKDYPIGVADLSEVLLDVKSKNADALVIGSYPADSILLIKQLTELKVDLKALVFLIGPGISGFEDIYPAGQLEGVSMEGPWHQSANAAAQKFYDDYVAKFGSRPDITDAPYAYLGPQLMQQAIEKAGTLDSEKLRETLANETFDTIFGQLKFDGQQTLQFHGFLQWQKGKIEAVWPVARASAPWEFPKPAWQ